MVLCRIASVFVYVGLVCVCLGVRTRKDQGSLEYMCSEIVRLGLGWAKALGIEEAAAFPDSHFAAGDRNNLAEKKAEMEMSMADAKAMQTQSDKAAAQYKEAEAEHKAAKVNVAVADAKRKRAEEILNLKQDQKKAYDSNMADAVAVSQDDVDEADKAVIEASHELEAAKNNADEAAANEKECAVTADKRRHEYMTKEAEATKSKEECAAAEALVATSHEGAAWSYLSCHDESIHDESIVLAKRALVEHCRKVLLDGAPRSDMNKLESAKATLESSQIEGDAEMQTWLSAVNALLATGAVNALLATGS